MDYSSLPKVELHLHLDCCLSYEVVKQLDSTVTYDSYKESFIAPAKCTDLADYITRAIKGYELMQTRDQLRLVTLDLFSQLKADNVIYAEIRFAPLQHLLKGLRPTGVIEAVNNAVAEGIKETGVEASIILCTLRHYSEQQSLQTALLAAQFRGTHVSGFDIAADEAGFPVTNHIKAFRFANANHIKCTAHAGEAKGSDSVWETIHQFHPLRIGHGVRSMEDMKLVAFLKKRNIHLEVCPTSNIQTNVYDRIQDHTINKIYEAGLSMSISTDARTISAITLTSEYELIEKVFNWQKARFLKCNLEAIDHAFIAEEKKTALKEKLLVAYNA